MTKTVSSRIPKELHDKLKEKCDNEGCNTNDFIRNILANELEQESKEESHRIIIKPNEESKPKPEEIPELKEPKILVNDVPKITIKEVPQDNSNKPQVYTVLFGNEYIPYAEVYQT